uniref:KIB1-4 beta-propeller domain-containing protein n=1 Tax=Oryza glumipatula TaxID=40148 RepID=A0A0E0BCS5_9ORYZ
MASGGGGWSSLPADLLREVSGRLYSDADHLHIHQVCAHWRASTLPVSACRPWVVAGRALQRGLVPIGDYSLRLPGGGAERMDAGLRRAPPGLRHCCGASRGWLALADDARSPTRLALWEPLSGAEIPLPCLSPITRVSLSGDPLASPVWVAMASQLKGREGQKTLVCRRGDAAWTVLFERGTSEIDTVVFHRGKVYYIDILRNIVVCDLDAKCTQAFHACTPVSMLCSCDKFHPERGVHLVACDDEVLLVVVRWGGHPSLAEIYRPEWKGNHQLELGERVMDLVAGSGSALTVHITPPSLFLRARPPSQTLTHAEAAHVDGDLARQWGGGHGGERAEEFVGDEATCSLAAVEEILIQAEPAEDRHASTTGGAVANEATVLEVGLAVLGLHIPMARAKPWVARGGGLVESSGDVVGSEGTCGGCRGGRLLGGGWCGRRARDAHHQVDFSARPFRAAPDSTTVLADTILIAATSTSSSMYDSHMYIIRRRSTFRASKIMQARALSNPKIQSGGAEGGSPLVGVNVKNLVTGAISDLQEAVLFFAIRHESETELLGGQLELDADVHQSELHAHHVKGVFAAGDVQDKKYLQAIIVAGSVWFSGITSKHNMGR